MIIHINVFKGPEAAPYIRPLSEMRVKAFAEFPYLYEGNVEDDFAYAHLYASDPQGMIVVAFEGDQIVGVRSGCPVPAHTIVMDESRCQMLEDHGIQAKAYYYCGEIIVDPAFQRKGIATQLMTRFIEEVKEMGFPGMIAITSIKPDDHPLRPHDYFDSGLFLKKFGFEKSPITFTAEWPTRQGDGTVKTQENELAFWVRKLD